MCVLIRRVSRGVGGKEPFSFSFPFVRVGGGKRGRVHVIYTHRYIHSYILYGGTIGCEEAAAAAIAAPHRLVRDVACYVLYAYVYIRTALVPRNMYICKYV